MFGLSAAASTTSGMMNQYMDFFTKFNVLGLAIGLMIGSNLKDVAGDFIDDVLMPIVNPILNIFTKGNGVTLHIPATGIKINLERVIASSIKFMALSVIIFVMIQLGVKLKKPVQWVSVRNWDKMGKTKTSSVTKKSKTKGNLLPKLLSK